MVKTILVLTFFIAKISFAKTMTFYFDQCFEGKTPAKLFIYKIDKLLKKNKKILKDPGLDGSIARTLGAFSIPSVEVPANYDTCLSRLYETFTISDQKKKQEAFNDWYNCLPDNESIKKEVKKLKKCFKVD